MLKFETILLKLNRTKNQKSPIYLILQFKQTIDLEICFIIAQN